MKYRRVVDFGLYIVIGTGFAFALVWGAMNSRLTGAEVFGKWAGLVVNTLILFGYTLNSYRAAARRGKLWFVLGALLSAHVCIYIWALQAVSSWKVSWWIVLTPIEYIVIGLILNAAGIRISNHGDGSQRSR